MPYTSFIQIKCGSCSYWEGSKYSWWFLKISSCSWLWYIIVLKHLAVNWRLPRCSLRIWRQAGRVSKNSLPICMFLTYLLRLRSYSFYSWLVIGERKKKIKTHTIIKEKKLFMKISPKVTAASVTVGVSHWCGVAVGSFPSVSESCLEEPGFLLSSYKLEGAQRKTAFAASSQLWKAWCANMLWQETNEIYFLASSMLELPMEVGIVPLQRQD